MKKLRFLSIVSALLVVISGLLGCSDDVTPREGAIEGRILNLAGKPIADALVEWEYDNTKWSITDKNGSYFVDSIGFGDQHFVVTANGYRSVTFMAPVYSGQTSKVNDVSLQGMSFNYSDIKVTKTTATSVLITWKTSDYTNSIIEYGLTESLGQYFREAADLYTTTHSLEVTGLKPEKTYYFRISGNRKGQAIESSTLSTFSTLSALEDDTAPNPPTNVETSLNGVANQVVVFWNPCPDSDLKGYKIYRSEVSNGSFTEVSNGFIARGQERFTDTSVIPGKKYFYHVTAVDQANNESGYNNVSGILVPGDITSDVRWTVANSPYIVKGDINITEFGILRIDGGVQVKIEPTDGLRRGSDLNKIEINVNGAIIASAGNYLPIVISGNSSTSAKGTWKGISFSNVSNVSNTMVNFEIHHADTAITLDNSTGVFSNIKIEDSNTGMSISNSKNLTVDRILTKYCQTGITLNDNTSVGVTNSTFMHPKNAIISERNNGLSVTGCNILENTETGIVSNETGGIVELLNNLFVSPTSLALQVNGYCQRIESSVFDTPFAIQIKSEVPTIQKNLFMAEVAKAKGIYAEGQKCIEYLGSSSIPEFGPNNVENFTSENAYIGCIPDRDSTNTSDIMLMKDLYDTPYDYRLKQPYPSNSDPWGIIRDSNPYDGK